MKLIIDAGNTVVKLAVFEGVNLICKGSSDYLQLYEKIIKLVSGHPKINSVIASLVAKVDKNQLILFFRDQNIAFVELSHLTSVPFINRYQTPETLGVDRIALMASAVSQYPNKNCLVIDAGSCVTYDFINADREYYGGTISLGLQMRYKSLHQFTAQLPLLRPKHNDSFVGGNTNEAIHAGVCLALITEIEGVIQFFSNKYTNLVVILTGGDADFLSKRLKNSIFVLPNFLIEGLSHILDYNTNK